MSPIVFIVGGILALSLIFVLWLIWRAPEGQQDREGFHDQSGEKSGAGVVGEEGGGSEARKVG